MKEEFLLLLSDLQKLINQVVLIDYTIIILGGETMLKLAQRIYNLLDDVKAESENKTYLLVAHNGIARVIQSYFEDMTNEEYAGFGIRNCQIVEYRF